MERSTRQRIGAGLTVLAVVVLGASLWYWRIEGLTPVDAVYQTVITISTVGFGEIQDLGERGRLFTMVVILLGAGTTAYTLLALFEYFAEERLEAVRRRRMERSAERMIDHMIVCGFGRVGSLVAKAGAAQGDVVVVEPDPERAEAAEADGLVVVRGDATEEDVLEQAGVGEAAVLVPALSSDAENLYIVMTARGLNGDLRIVARSQSDHSAGKLRRAGADQVVNPEEIGASRMYAFATRPTVSDFLDAVLGEDVEFELDEATIGPESQHAGVTLGEAKLRKLTGAVVLALRGSDGRYVAQLGEDALLEPGSTAIALGTRDQLQRLRRTLDPEGVHRQEMRKGTWPYI